MVNVTRQADMFTFDVQGLHKLWAFKSQLQIPAAHIRSARQDAAALGGWWKGWRMPGTHVPGLLTAGTYFKDGRRIFWDVHDEHQAVIIELEHEDYDQLIIEVRDPAAVVRLLNEGR
ncbi:hypothetical protein [Hymenobacter edaphi]|uniref:Bacterial Pleckstrin homology domain-containing protein n=1 Tax=Hymenobacter edaphi TaxID=2211146 RepID=A0A328BWF2_9BACT|nr:hypothetical protein [Hymenobacter edaphi]RAK69408.1 hypothetical protein DLM85_00650 [Hymenobacter edaphi]